jgi:glycosyltransferase involved in cell wall biosynthesis
MVVLFIGSLVPDTSEFRNSAFGYSGQLVQEGLVDGFISQRIPIDILSFRPMSYFPRGEKLFSSRLKVNYNHSTILVLAPIINLMLLRELFGGIYAFFFILIWSLRNISKKQIVMQYGVYTPPLPFVYLAVLFSKAKLISVLYDIGVPPSTLNLGRKRMLIYKFVDFYSKIFIPKLDGRIAINKKVVEDYSQEKHSLIIDGGLSNKVIEKMRLFETSDIIKSETIFMFGGSLWPINGIEILLRAFEMNANPDIRLWFAGKGVDEELIKAAARNDNRIIYLGMLGLGDLYKYYIKSDVLLNIRVSDLDECKYFFPSKFFEYLATGKYVITSSVSHIREEYGTICYVIDETTSQNLSNVFDEIHNKTKSELKEVGLKARDFVLMHKSWEKQTENIIYYIMKNILKK